MIVCLCGRFSPLDRKPGARADVVDDMRAGWTNRNLTLATSYVDILFDVECVLFVTGGFRTCDRNPGTRASILSSTRGLDPLIHQVSPASSTRHTNHFRLGQLVIQMLEFLFFKRTIYDQTCGQSKVQWSWTTPNINVTQSTTTQDAGLVFWDRIGIEHCR